MGTRTRLRALRSTATREAPGGRPLPYWCSDCRRYFSVRTGTALEHSKVPLRKWAIAFYLEATSPKGISSIALGRAVGVRQATAWFMLHRIREGWPRDAKVRNRPRPDPLNRYKTPLEPSEYPSRAALDAPNDAWRDEITGRYHQFGLESQIGDGCGLSPSRRRQCIDHVCDRLGVSKRRACRVLGQHRSTQRRIPRGSDDEDRLVADMIALARQYGRYGYRRIAVLLRDAGWQVNDKRVDVSACGGARG